MAILVVQHIASVPLGLLSQYFRNSGVQFQIWSPLEQPMPPSGHYSGLIVLGGTMNACEDETFPHLRQVVDFIQQFAEANLPILGICLGAQLIARSFGSRVYSNPTPELGFTPVYPVKTRDDDPILCHCPENLHMMQWHFDTFDLPQEAELLMSSQTCRNQFYRIQSNIYGVQFHLEVTPEIVRSWLAFQTPWIREHYPSLPQDLETQIKRFWLQSAQFAERIAQVWLSEVSGQTLALN